MKILVDARSLVEAHRGGVGRVAYALVRTYAETFPEDQLICVTTGWSRPSLPVELESLSNITHRHYRVPNKIWSAASTIVPLPSFVTKDADAIFLPNLGFVGKLPKTIPTTLLLHDLSFVIDGNWFTRKQRLWHRLIGATSMIRSAKQLLAVSERTRQDTHRLLGVPLERITTIPIGAIDLGEPATDVAQGASDTSQGAGPGQAQGLPLRGKRFVLAMGANDRRKNAATAIEAVRRLREEPGFGDLELVLIGSRPGLSELWIHQLPRPTDSEMAFLYREARAFLYPSWYEGYGLPLHEATHFGTPCISSLASALPETAPRGTIFADPTKTQHWIEALKQVLTLPEEHRTTNLETGNEWKEAARQLRTSYTKPPRRSRTTWWFLPSQILPCDKTRESR